MNGYVVIALGQVKHNPIIICRTRAGENRGDNRPTHAIRDLCYAELHFATLTSRCAAYSRSVTW